ncbi:tetratricopeptide repeat protein [Aeromicrobium marinum DSM 15272]|uniref:Tetratricopeptide repeat protein n=1 Tax=Aeromicrobium marinum DSM 15272 TaxID=585531 RepID=E2S8X1_9ACTN|nr:tetratricopeptide repeat protein [Aeromicrobium marinum]EFQ84626.1 tetratricopeptide repeat protein [Aeromicrobium marinum DSM 15272]
MALAPLALVPGGFARFVVAPLLVVSVAIAVGARARATGRLPAAVVGVVGAGSLVLLVAALASVSPAAALLGRWPRYEGVVVLGLYVASAWLGARLLGGERHPATATTLLRATAVGALVLAAFSVLDALGASPLGGTDATRPGALLGNATDQGIVAMIAMAVLLRPALTDRQALHVAGLVASVLTIGLAGSRAVIGAAAVVVVVHLAAGVRGGRRPLLLVLGGLVAVVAILPQARERLLGFHTVTGRSVLWTESLELGLDHPWLGVGPSGFVDAIPRYHDDDWVERVGVAAPPDSPHLWLLQAWSAGGLLLVLLAVALAGLIAALGWRGVRRRPDDPLVLGLFAATVGYGLVLSTHFTIAGTTPWAAFLAGGLIAAAARESRSPLPLATSVAAGTAAVVLLAACVGEVVIRDGVDAAAAGRGAAADRSFEIAAGWRPWDVDLPLIAAQALAGATSGGDESAVDPTVRWAARSLELTPDSSTAGLALAVALLRRGELAEALQVLDGVVALAPTDPQAHVQRALARFGLQDGAGAVDDLERAVELDPEDPTAADLLEQIEQRLAGPPGD